MGTRATYEIDGKTFYKHWDGYEVGAASFFWRMVAWPNKRGTMAERFLRAIDDAEFTESRDAHGDTEYHYTIERNKSGKYELLAENRRFDSNAWRIVYAGSLMDFINQHAEEFKEWFDDKEYTYSPVIVNRYGHLATLEEAEKEMLRELAQAEVWKEGGHIGNAAGGFSSAWDGFMSIKAHLEPGRANAVRERILSHSEDMAQRYGHEDIGRWNDIHFKGWRDSGKEAA